MRTCCTTRRVTDLLPDARCRSGAWRARARPRRQHRRAPRARSPSVPTASARSSPSSPARRCPRRAGPRARCSTATSRGPRRRPATSGRTATAPRAGPDPHQRRRDLRLRRAPRRTGCDRCAGPTGREAAFATLLSRPAPDARPGRLDAAPPRARCTAGPASPVTSAGRGGRAGRWSATRATSRTRSPRTASPTRCAMPSCSPTRCSRRSLAPSPSGRAGAATSARRDRLSSDLFAATEEVAAYDWDMPTVAGAPAPGQLGDERRGGPPPVAAGPSLGTADASSALTRRTWLASVAARRKGRPARMTRRASGCSGASRSTVDGAPVAVGRVVAPAGRRRWSSCWRSRPGAGCTASRSSRRCGPGPPSTRPAPRLHKAAHYARRALGGDGCRGAAAQRHGRAAARRATSASTPTEFRAAAEAGARGPVGAEAAEQALAAYAGPLLPDDLYEPWAERRRASDSRRCTRDLLRLAERWDDVLAEDPPTKQAHLALIRGARRPWRRTGGAAAVRAARPGAAPRARHDAQPGGRAAPRRS